MTFGCMCVQSKTAKHINCGDQTGNNFEAACVSPSLCTMKSTGKVAVAVSLIVIWFCCECIFTANSKLS